MQPQASSVGFTVRDGERSLILHRPTFALEIFEEAMPLLEQALSYSSEYGVDDLYSICREGKMQFWTLQDTNEMLQMVMVTGIIEYPRVKDLHIYALAGSNLRAAARFLPSVKEFMAWNEATRLTAAVRPQFMQILKRYGFAHLDCRAVLPVMERPNATRH